MESDERCPGLKIRFNKDGSKRPYWIARADLVKRGYTPKTVRLSYNPDDRGDRLLLDAACKRLQAEMLEWAAGKPQNYDRFSGTLASLIRNYQRNEASPYRELKWNTRRTYDDVLDKIERAFGKRVLKALKILDFRRWYDEAKKPKKENGPERVRKAHGIVTMLRRLFSFGVMMEYPECGRLLAILDQARFKQPGRRRSRLDLCQAQAFIAMAIEKKRPSLALGTAIQFETGMRQRDVIGEWEPIDQEERPTGIVLRGRKGQRWRRWVNGLTWADLANDFVISKETTKTGAIVSHDLKLCPLVMDVIERFGPAARVGPLIMDETAGRPYAEFAYGRDWRAFARQAGIPDQVWNMDARAGAITEAEDAGAELDEIRGAVGHTQASTTARYSRGAIGKSRRVATLRAAHRAVKNSQ